MSERGKMWMWCLVILASLLPAALCDGGSIYRLNMPKVRPYKPELYLCTPVRINPLRSYYITGFSPNASVSVAHHVLLYGCSEPGLRKSVWNCGEMTDASTNRDLYQKASVCAQDTQVIYGWAMDAPALELPEGVAFKVGKDTSIKYLVLQVHYGNVDKFKDGSTDETGIVIHFTKKPMYNSAGVLVALTGGAIPPMQTEHMETTCTIDEDKVIHPFAFRVHTHKLGKVVAGYKVARNSWGLDRWTLLGKKSPQEPQMFYPVNSTKPLRQGDVLAARCTVLNNQNHWVYVGQTKNDEMCNFYLMYYVKGQSPLEKKYCISPGPPVYYWGQNDGLNNIPNAEASEL